MSGTISKSGTTLGRFDGSSVYTAGMLGAYVGRVENGKIYVSRGINDSLVGTYSNGRIYKLGGLNEHLASYGHGKLTAPGILDGTIASYTGRDDTGGPAAALLTIFSDTLPLGEQKGDMQEGEFYTTSSGFWGSRELLGSYKKGKIYAPPKGLLEEIFGPSEVLGHYKHGEIFIAASRFFKSPIRVGRYRNGKIYASNKEFWHDLFEEGELLASYKKGKIFAPSKGWFSSSEVLGTYDGNDSGGAAAGLLLLYAIVQRHKATIQEHMENHPNAAIEKEYYPTQASDEYTPFKHKIDVDFDPNDEVDASVADALFTIQDSYTHRYAKNGLYYITSKQELSDAQELYNEHVEGKIIKSPSLQQFADQMKEMMMIAEKRRLKNGYIGMFQWLPIIILMVFIGVSLGGWVGLLLSLVLSTWSFLFVQYIPGWKLNKMLLTGNLYANTSEGIERTGESTLKDIAFALVLWIVIIIGGLLLLTGGLSTFTQSTRSSYSGRTRNFHQPIPKPTQRMSYNQRVRRVSPVRRRFLATNRPNISPKHLQRLFHKSQEYRNLSGKYAVIVYGHKTLEGCKQKQQEFSRKGVHTIIVRSQDFSNLNPGWYILVSNASLNKRVAKHYVKKLRRRRIYDAYSKAIGHFQAVGMWMTVRRGHDILLWKDPNFREKSEYYISRGEQALILSLNPSRNFRTKKNFWARQASGRRIRLRRNRTVLPKEGELYFYKSKRGTMIRLSKSQKKRYLQPLGMVYRIRTRTGKIGWIANYWFH